MKSFRKSAVPEYIWYISLIIISITLVVGIANIAKKGNKNIEPPSNVNVKFDLRLNNLNQIIFNDLHFVGQWDLDKDTPNLYIGCNGKYLPLQELFSPLKEWFVRKADGTQGLKGSTLFIGKENLEQYFGEQCVQKGAIWELWYGNPNEGGVMLAQDVVDRKWSLN